MCEVVKVDNLTKLARGISGFNWRIDDLRVERLEKEEQIERLKEAQADLIDIRNEFFDEIKICEEPAFSSKTFYGDNSTIYDRYRNEILKDDFKDVSNTQTMNAIAKMQEKINELSTEKNEITDDINNLISERNILQNSLNYS